MPTSFRPGGYKITDGQTFRPLFTVEFGSRSNPSARPYTTIFWDDGDLSCNCRGWATHKNCRHCVALHEAALARGLTAYGVPAAVAQRASHLRDAFTQQLPRVSRTYGLETRPARRSPRQPTEAPPAPVLPVRRIVL